MWKNFLYCEMYDELVTDGALVYNCSVFWRNVKTLLSCSCMRTLSVPQGRSMLTTWGRSRQSFLSWRYWMGSVMSFSMFCFLTKNNKSCRRIKVLFAECNMTIFYFKRERERKYTCGKKIQNWKFLYNFKTCG